MGLTEAETSLAEAIRANFRKCAGSHWPSMAHHCAECVRHFTAEEALRNLLDRSDKLEASLLRVNELENTLQGIEESARRVIDSRARCEICNVGDGTVQYRGWHDEDVPMMTCKTCGQPDPPSRINGI